MTSGKKHRGKAITDVKILDIKKLTQILQHAEPTSLTIVHMEVPRCFGLVPPGVKGDSRQRQRDTFRRDNYRS